MLSPGQTAAWCAAHKADGMVNNRHRLCAYPNCTSHATFKHVGDQHPTFCGAHREDGMVQARTPSLTALSLKLMQVLNLHVFADTYTCSRLQRKDNEVFAVAYLSHCMRSPVRQESRLSGVRCLSRHAAGSVQRAAAASGPCSTSRARSCPSGASSTRRRAW